jgi:hypothetical protein
MPAVVAAGAGEALLGAEVAAPLFEASASFIPAAGELAGLSAMEGMGGLGALGTGLSALNGLGGAMGPVGSGLGQLAGSGLAGVAPEAAAQIQAAQAASVPGANQIASTLGANQGIGASVTPQVPIQQSAMLQSATEEIPSLTPDQMAAREALYGDVGYGAGAGVEPPTGLEKLWNTIKDYGSSAYQWWDKQDTPHKALYGGAALLGANALFGKKQGDVPDQAPYSGPLSKFHYDPAYYKPTMPAQPTPYKPVYQNYRNYADGGAVMDGGSPGMQLQGNNDPLMFQSTGVERMADGGIASLGHYSDGGQMLKGPGDGMSDSIPATIAGKQPARLANDEFVVPADVVSHLGNGSSDAGAKQLYKMMDRVRQARTGNKKQGKQIDPNKLMPA